MIDQDFTQDRQNAKMSDLQIFMTTGAIQDGLKMAPRWTQDVPKMAQDGAKLAQDGPKTVPGCPQMRFRWPKMAPRWPKMAQDCPKTSLKTLRIARSVIIMKIIRKK